MSLFGKILAGLNILAAVAFVVIGFMDFAKREAWAYANYVHDVAFVGLPLDDKQLDDRENPLKYKLAASTQKEWFDPTGGPVSTQVEEVDRIKKALDAKTATAAGGDAQKETVELARILTPFARHNSEREWLLSVRTSLAAPDAEAKLHKRLHDAFTPAVAACVAGPGLKFPQAFAEACRAQSVEPDAAFVQTFLRLLPAKPEKTFDEALKAAQALPAPTDAHAQATKFLQTLRDDSATVRSAGDDPADTLDAVYKDTLAAVHDQLKKQLDDLYDQAKNGPNSVAAGGAERLRNEQRGAIARYLFNMVEVLDPDAAQQGVVAAPAYNRFIRVVGANQAAQEISDQAGLLQTIGEELQSERDLERGAFAIAHLKLIDELKSRAVRLHNADDLLADTTALFDKQKDVTQVQQTKVDALEKDLAAARAATDAAMTNLRNTSDSLHKMRMEGRDVLGQNLELEQKIKDLENKR